jgi:hypothetical protein
VAPIMCQPLKVPSQRGEVQKALMFLSWEPKSCEKFKVSKSEAWLPGPHIRQLSKAQMQLFLSELLFLHESSPEHRQLTER